LTCNISPLLCLLTLGLFYLIYYFISDDLPSDIDLSIGDADKSGHVSYIYDDEGVLHSYTRYSPLLFIGGHPRSGTTLMRAIMDSHHMVRCGEETRIIPRMVAMKDRWTMTDVEVERLLEAGIDDQVMDSAISSFILDIMVNHGEPASVLCNKDPLTLKHGSYMAKLFPNSKWLFMMRDGRAVVHSIIKRNVSISGYDMNNPRQCLTKWNKMVQSMYYECKKIGSIRCMIVHYEQLVLHPKKWISKITDFLDLPWDDSTLHHERNINVKGGVRTSKTEKSTDQIVKPINVDALNDWVGFYDQDILNDMNTLAPMLRKMGYDPEDNDPVYGVPDNQVLKNTNKIHKEEAFSKRQRLQPRRGPRPVNIAKLSNSYL